MNNNIFAGALIRKLRLELDWSQETLCKGICAVSYLSKIEQGRVNANEDILIDLFSRMGYVWDAADRDAMQALCEEAYDAVFSCNRRVTKECKHMLLEAWNTKNIGPWYLDLLVLRAYYCSDSNLIPPQMIELLNDRQSCLVYLLNNEPELAIMRYPCPLAELEAGSLAYARGEYTRALEYLNRSYRDASDAGYVHLMMYCKAFMANCYSDLHDLPGMRSHILVAQRLAKTLDDKDLLRTIEYNIASTEIECGEYENAYAYFRNLKDPSVMELHKLAICCEKTGRLNESFIAISQAVPNADEAEQKMLRLIQIRLENPAYLQDAEYGKILTSTFLNLKQERSSGYAKFHWNWIEEWCVANRLYRQLYDFSKFFL